MCFVVCVGTIANKWIATVRDGRVVNASTTIQAKFTATIDSRDVIIVDGIIVLVTDIGRDFTFMAGKFDRTVATTMRIGLAIAAVDAE